MSAARALPPGIGFEWTELAFQERNAGNPIYIFMLGVLFVFLVLYTHSRALPKVGHDLCTAYHETTRRVGV